MKFILENKTSLVLSTIAITLAIPSLALAGGDISVVGMDLYNKIAMGGSTAVLIKGGWDVIQSFLSSDWPKVKQVVLYSAGVVLVLVLFPTFIHLVETTAKGMR